MVGMKVPQEQEQELNNKRMGLTHPFLCDKFIDIAVIRNVKTNIKKKEGK